MLFYSFIALSSLILTVSLLLPKMVVTHTFHAIHSHFLSTILNGLQALC